MLGILPIRLGTFSYKLGMLAYRLIVELAGKLVPFLYIIGSQGSSKAHQIILGGKRGQNIFVFQTIKSRILRPWPF